MAEAVLGPAPSGRRDSRCWVTRGIRVVRERGAVAALTQPTGRASFYAGTYPRFAGCAYSAGRSLRRRGPARAGRLGRSGHASDGPAALSRRRRMSPSPDWPFFGVRWHCNGRRSISRMRGGPRQFQATAGRLIPMRASGSERGRQASHPQRGTTLVMRAKRDWPHPIQNAKSEAIPLRAPSFHSEAR